MAAKSVAPFQSIASIGSEVGRVAERHMDRTFRRIRGQRAVIDRRFVRLVTGEAHPFGNFTLIADPRDEDATRAAVEPLCAVNAPAAALFVGAVSPAIDSNLRRLGFEAHVHMPAMAVEIDRMGAAPLPKGCVLERFSAGERDDQWIDAFAEGFEIPRATAAEFSPTSLGAGGEDAPVQLFGVSINGQLVATSTMTLDDGVAGIYCVSTVPDKRGQGLGAYIATEPLRHARSLGYRVGVLQATEPGYPIYVRLGFEEFGTIPFYVRMPG